LKRVILATFILLFLFPTVVIADVTPQYTSNQIIENAKELDNKQIQYRGEVIGDPLVRGEFVWLSVNDGVTAISIYISTKLLPDSLVFGKYAVRGDVLTFTGIFHRACAEHGGDLDLHALSLELNETGFAIPVQRSAKFTILTGIVSFCAVCGLFYVKKIHATLS